MYKLIASPFLGSHFVLKPGAQNGVKVSATNYQELLNFNANNGECPPWLVDAARNAWSVDLADQLLSKAVLVRRLKREGLSTARHTRARPGRRVHG